MGKNYMSMEELAEEINISRQTLSSIINGTWKEKRISKVTYNKTIALIEQFGYVPHSSARQLSKTKNDTIGLIYHGNFFSHISKAVEYLNDFFYTEKVPVNLKMTSSLALKETIKELLGNRVNKIIIINTFDNLAERIIEENLLPFLQKVPVIIYNYHFDYEKDKEHRNILLQHGISLIGFSRAKIYTKFLDKLQNSSYTTLFIDENTYYRLINSNFPEEKFSFFKQLHTYKQADREDMGFDEFLVGENLGKQLFPKLPADGKSVIVTDSDMVAEGLAVFLIRKGIDIPNQIGLLGFDNLNATNYFKIPISTIEVPVKEMIDNLIRLLQSPINSDSKAFISKSKIIYRKSLILS
jgi:LacI family transcriptional regulator